MTPIIALSGLLWPKGPPGRLLDAAEAHHIALASSVPLLAELQGVLTRPKFAGQLAKHNLVPSDLFDGYATLIICVSPASTPHIIERDRDDDHVLACALAASATYIVSGDHHLLDLHSHHDIPIITPAAAVARLDPEETW